MHFSEEERKRYHRQMLMEGWGEETQKKLKDSTVFVAGAGGLGSPVSIYLSVAGIGHLRICDFDSPDWSNLNRQILHDHTRIGVNKAVSAKMTIERINPAIRVTAFTDKIIAENVDALVGDADIIMDGMDNFPTRYLLNEAGDVSGEAADWLIVEERTREALRLRHRSLSTEKTYLLWIRHFQGFVKDRQPFSLEGKDIQAFLSYLAVEKRVSAAHQL